MLVYPCEEADLPVKQLEDLVRLEMAVRDALAVHMKKQSNYRAAFGVILILNLLFLWSDFRNYQSREEDIESLTEQLLMFVRFYICMTATLLLLSHKSCREKLQEGKVYLLRINKVLKTLHLYFDKKTSKLNVLVEKQFGSSFELK